MATQLAETADDEAAEVVVVVAADEAVENAQPQEHDYETEARASGWKPAEELADPAKFVDAKTFVERGEKYLPIVRERLTKAERDLAKTRDEMADLKRTMKQANAFYTKTEERAYQRALTDLHARHDEAVEAGDTKAARAVVEELTELEKPAPEDKSDVKQAQRAFAEWEEAHDWYLSDETKAAYVNNPEDYPGGRAKWADDLARTTYADRQARDMGLALEYDGGPKAYLDEMTRRVNRKFADPKPNPTNGGGNRPGGQRGAKTFSDLPADAKKQCERFVKQIPGFTKEQYVKDFDWSTS